MGEIDYSTGTCYFSLTTERAKKRGNKVTVTDDITWKVTQNGTLKQAWIGGTVRIRDWRWLWLRRKTYELRPFNIKL